MSVKVPFIFFSIFLTLILGVTVVAYMRPVVKMGLTMKNIEEEREAIRT